LSVIGAFLVFFLRIGGDAQVYYRMWLWVLPMFSLLAAEGLAKVENSNVPLGKTLASGLAVGMVVASLVHSFAGTEIERVRRDEAFVRDVVVLAESLGQLPADTLIAANNVGALSYVSGLPTVDMLGLNDRHIARAPGKKVGVPAHESHDGAYVLDQQPDLIFLKMPRVYAQQIPPELVLAHGYPSDLDLLRDSRFGEDYEFRQLLVSDGRYAPVFKRKRPPTRGGS
jgi:hypothetical protein